MTYLQDNFELNWLNISRDWWWEVNITPSLGIGLKKSKSLSFVCKEKFLTSVGVKSNHESMIKSNDGIFFIMEVRIKVDVSLGDSLNKNISRKK